MCIEFCMFCATLRLVVCCKHREREVGGGLGPTQGLYCIHRTNNPFIGGMFMESVTT